MLLGRNSITQDEHNGILAHLRDDLETHRLRQMTLDFEQVCATAMRLSRQYTSRFLTRSLDLLHVAAAHEIACRTFVSADDRQLRVARASGLRTLDIKRRFRA